MNKTPMMRQYDEAKQACGDALLFFRMGDFYELFHDDAKVAANALGLTLTSRDKSNTVPMAGFPHHQLDGYLGKLIKQGFRVAVCDQVEDPKTAKGLVKREIQQIVSPGTVTDQALLDPATSNYLAAILPGTELKTKSQRAQHEDEVGVAWCDISTGRFYATRLNSNALEDLISRLGPSEVLIPDRMEQELACLATDVMVTRRPDWAFGEKVAREKLLKQFQVASLDGFGIEMFGEVALGAAGAILDYLAETQKASLEHIDRVIPFQQNDFVEVDSATWRSLEISQTIRTGQRDGSLFGVMDRCQTPMGSRMLGEWLANPLNDLAAINIRHDSVDELTSNQAARESIREFLKHVFDLQRLLARVATGRAMPRDINHIEATLRAVPSLKDKLDGLESSWLSRLNSDLDACEDLTKTLANAVVDRAPGARQGRWLFKRRLQRKTG